ncbi:hypothetical protein E0K89_001820 [Aquicoccus sp. SCR17]|nr:hypothetical protein [Carideicomes alvinocaridis]
MMAKLIACVMALLVLCGPATAQDPREAASAALRDLVSDDAAKPGDFAPSFLQQVPIERVRALIEDLRGRLGPVTAVVPQGDGFAVRSETHEVSARIALDAEGRIVMLVFGAPVALSGDLRSALDGLAALPGEVAWLITRDGEMLSARSPDRPLAVGSAFKLGVLAALRAEIDEGERDWSDVERLQAHDISLPSGLLQTMPAGAPLTLHTAAALMISQSDNTATDFLIDVLGRGPVKKVLDVPSLLTTREFFSLKADLGLREPYLAAAPEDREEIAAEAAKAPLPPVEQVSQGHSRGIEWYLPLTRLCSLMGQVADLDLMSINPGPVPAADWADYAYKGGSEPGVLNLTAQVTDATGRNYCVALTVNAEPGFDSAKGISAYTSLLKVLARSKLPN